MTCPHPKRSGITRGIAVTRDAATGGAIVRAAPTTAPSVSILVTRIWPSRGCGMGVFIGRLVFSCRPKRHRPHHGRHSKQIALVLVRRSVNGICGSGRR